MALSTQPYKGARDFYPEDKRLQKYMFGVLRDTVERYGYEEYDAPILEPLEIYLAKSGEEIVDGQTYSFEDRGGRQVVIRPEMTPTVSRMVAAKRQELAYPLRWYSIPNLWRYERPQRGRLREHWQLNVDAFGIEPPYAEIEMLEIISAVFVRFGATPEMYEVKVNDRRLMDHLLHACLELDESQGQRVGKLIDKMHKIERQKFVGEVDAVLTPEQREKGTAEKLLSVLEATSLDDLRNMVADNAILSDLNDLLAYFKKLGVNNVKFDPTIMRGFDYYTGIVFEVFDTHPDNNRAMLGGGRYDGLVGLFGAQPVPTVGFGWGDVTLQNFLELHHLLPELQAETDLYVAVTLDAGSGSDALIAELRSEGLNVAVDYSGKKVGDQIKVADKKGIGYAVVLGPDEVTTKKLTVKRMADSNESSGTVQEVAEIIKASRQHDSN